jgi:dihydroorotate dehydrogenase (NAD+) catalytic subunit
MSVDLRSRQSRLGNQTGGLSGPAIKPITLRLVREAAKAVKVPVIALGGIETAEDVLEYLVVGAAAVQLGTASFADPKASWRILDGLEDLAKDIKCFNISDIRGSFLEKST